MVTFLFYCNKSEDIDEKKGYAKSNEESTSGDGNESRIQKLKRTRKKLAKSE